MRNKTIHITERRVGADEQENKEAGEDYPKPHTACFRNWNAHNGYQNYCREHPIMWRGGFPPQNNNIKVRLQNQDEKRNNERVLETGSSSCGINCSSCRINSVVEVSGVWRMVNFIYASGVSSTGVMV